MQKALVITMVMLMPVPLAHATEPVKHTLHGKFNPAKSYCNVDGKPGAKNVACYNHDACYDDPTFAGTRKPTATRKQCDAMFCKDTDAVSCAAVKLFGWSAWRRAREHDKDE